MQQQFDIAYSSTDPDVRKLDLFRPDAPNGAAILFIHGGGWAGGSRGQWHAVAEHFCRLGYVCASCSYHLLPDWTWRTQVEDVRLAMAFFKSRAVEYGFDADRVAAWGSSSGGHLAAMLATIGADDDLGAGAGIATRDTRPAVLVCLCSIYSCHKVGGYYKADFLGATEEANPDEVAAASPIDRVCGDEPPFLMLVGDVDRSTPVAMNEAMKARLEEHGGRAEIIVLPDAVHGYGYGVETDQQKATIAHAERFLNEELVEHGATRLSRNV